MVPRLTERDYLAEDAMDQGTLNREVLLRIFTKFSRRR